MQALTDIQREYAEEHHQLIYGFLHEYLLSFEEWYGVAALGYCKAVTRYEPERELSFSTFAYRVMLNEVRMEMRKAQAYKRRAVLVSLESELCEGFTLEDTLGYEPHFMEDEPMTAAEEFIGSMDTEQQLIITLLSEGDRQGEIAKKLGVTRGEVSKRVKAMRERFKKEYPCRKEVIDVV